MIKKNIRDLTLDEVDVVIKMSGVFAPDNNKLRMISRKEDKITIWNHDCVLMITNKEIHKVAENGEDRHVENNLQIAQYLIDQGYEFKYDPKEYWDFLGDN